jgi:hypothetical protein
MSTTAGQAPDEQAAEPMPAAKRPVAAGLLTVLGVIWALALIALAVICVRDALVAFGALGGEPWINSVTETLDGLSATRWMYLIGAVCVVLGLFLLVAAVKPRPRRGIHLEADTTVLVSTSAVRRLASSAAGEVDGVDKSSVTASRKRVTVDAAVLSTARAEEVEANISSAVSDRLSALRENPQVRVRTKSVGGDL